MSSVQRISVANAAERLTEGSVVYVDVRTPIEFDQGHPPGAVNVPWMLAVGDRLTPNPDFLRVMRAHFPPHRAVVVGCHSGARSRRCASALIAAGYEDVLEMSAGFDGSRDAFGRLDPGWRRTDLPVEVETAASQTYEWLLERCGTSATHRE